ncbi:MAG: glycosyltransferase family 4 protein [Armatimonadetes bacterium]|nr:glycosyltransferase family 4 protein [Armatimonadota bacterium]
MRVGLDARALASPIRSGVEQYVINLTRALATLGTAPEIVAYVDRSLPKGEPTAAGASSPVRIELLEARRGWLRAALPWRLWRDGADLVHLPSTILPPLLPCPAVVTVHDLAWAKFPDTYSRDDLRMQTQVVPKSVRRAAHVIAVSQTTARDVQEILHTDPARITAIPLGVSPVYSPDGPRLAGNEFPGADGLSQGYILHAGGMHPRKNVAKLLEAYSLLRAQMSAPPLVIASSTETQWGSATVEEAHAWHLGDVVVFSGQLEEHLLSRLYRSAVLTVYPSLYEGFGLPILEAMASGVPVITSNRSSMAEVAGDAALLIDPEDAGEIADAMRQLLEDQEQRTELVRRGRERSQAFTWERTARETVEVYERAARG